MNELMPLLTVSVIAGFWSCADEAFMAFLVFTKSSIVRWSETKCRPADAQHDHARRYRRGRDALGLTVAGRDTVQRCQ